MTFARLLSSFLAGAIALAAIPAFAEDADTSAVDARTAIRVQRCDRFGDGDDYKRCVRIIRRLPSPGTGALPSEQKDEGFDWRLENILNRVEEKVKAAISFVGTMSKRFCRDYAEENDMTSRECMVRIRTRLEERIGTMLDEVFRADRV